MTWKWEYYLKDRGPFQTVQAAMDAMGLPKDRRPKHQRWDRLSSRLKGLTGDGEKYTSRLKKEG